MIEIDLKFTDWIKKIEGSFGKEEWVAAYSSYKHDFESFTLYCALISNDRVKKSLSDPSWDLRIGDGFPGFSFHYENGKEVGTYQRFSSQDIEPLVLWRDFHGIRKGYFEISEEFRHYFNLYEDRKNNKFVAIDENGDEEDVILINENKIQVKIFLEGW